MACHAMYDSMHSASSMLQYAGLLLVTKDMQSILGAIIGMASSPTWEELKKSSVNAIVFDKLISKQPSCPCSNSSDIGSHNAT